MAMNFNTNYDGTIEVNMDIAEAQEPIEKEIAVPLCWTSTAPLVREKLPVIACKCYRDVAGGPDVYLGPDWDCEGRGGGCYEFECNTALASCYCV